MKNLYLYKSVAKATLVTLLLSSAQTAVAQKKKGPANLEKKKLEADAKVKDDGSWKSDAFSPEFKLSTVKEISNKVADWQIAHPYIRPDWDWTEAALWVGMTLHADITRDAKYFQHLEKVAKDLNYKMGPRKDFGDDHAIGQLYLWNFLRNEIPEEIADARKVMTKFATRPHTESLEWKNKIFLREWAWCDSLFMAPPTLTMLYATTGEKQYLDNMDKLWWKTYDYLYDKESKLYYRDSRYFGAKESNGKKVFWARGNGWVIAGLANVLRYMPEDYPTRPRYVKLFKEMATSLKDIQLEDGSWHASLLDPAAFPSPESSGTAFFGYAFMWGINNNILSEKEFLEPTTRAWKRIVQNIHPDGKVGYIQPIGEDPRRVSKDMTAVYGVGGTLGFASEVQRHLHLKDATLTAFTSSNPSDQVRLNEVVELKWDWVTEKQAKASRDNIAVFDHLKGMFCTTQVVDNDQDGKPDALLFEADFTPKETRRFSLVLQNKLRLPAPVNKMTARFVPERKDDFAWENDRIAFRMYGPALAKENAKGGVDVWTKSVRDPIVNAWYKSGDYHNDKGTGLDGYKVGPSLGCGGLGYLDANGKLTPSPVFKNYKVIEEGPLRLKFQLDYAPVSVGGITISESRTISMLTGNHHFSVSSTFTTSGDATGIQPVSAIVTREEEANNTTFTDNSSLYWDPVMEAKAGYIGTFLLGSKKTARSLDGHLIAPLASDLTKPVSYHAGAVWQQIDAPNREEFKKFVLHAEESNESPIISK